MNPRVSVITPTWHRHESVIGRSMPSVAAQTLADVEHIIVSDGPDDDLRQRLAGVDTHRWRYVELPEHAPSSRWGESARIYGEQVAQADLLAQLDDDDEFRPRHLEVLVDAIEASGADFAYSQMALHWPDGRSAVVGTDPPTYGQIGVSFLYRRKLLELATWRTGFPSIDWDLVQRWMAAGATWTFVPEITIDAYPSSYWSPQ